MSKLQPQNTAGFNAGNNYLVKSMRVQDIKTDPEISEIFKINERVRQEVLQNIKKFNFDKSQPLTLQKGTNILLDGHTRLSAAIEAGLDEVPVVEREFDDRAAAMMYTFERQALRRNLTNAEILMAAEMLQERNHKGDGSAAKQLAERLCLSESTIKHAKKIVKEAPPEVLKAVKDGDMSIKTGYIKTMGKRTAGKKSEVKTEATAASEVLQAVQDDDISIKDGTSEDSTAVKVDFTVTDAYGLPEKVRFLKDAVILLAEAKLQTAAEFLIEHFLTKNEEAGFYELLPDSVRETLEKP